MCQLLQQVGSKLTCPSCGEHQLDEENVQVPFRANFFYIKKFFSGSDINNFMEFYRANFPNSTVFPKLHIREDHVQQWLQHWHIGFGIMGEQGAESLHAHIKKLERQYCGVANELERLKYIVKEHNLQSLPQLN